MKREITLIGYGNQGKAWAANLRDSAWAVKVSGRPDGEGMKAARADGYTIVDSADLPGITGMIALLLPDEIIPKFFGRYLAQPTGAAKDQGRTFAFAHGFSVTFGHLHFAANDDVVLVAPKGIGPKLRENFTKGGGVLGVLAVEQDSSGRALQKAQMIAEGLGLNRVGLIPSSFAEETKTDLLSEQVILCGIVPRLVEETVRFLVEKGVDPRIATYECLNELKLIVDMMVAHGIHEMYTRVSSAAKFGGLQAAETLLPDAELRPRLEALWRDIENGNFAKALLEDSQSGYLKLHGKMENFKDSLADKNRSAL